MCAYVYVYVCLYVCVCMCVCARAFVSVSVGAYVGASIHPKGHENIVILRHLKKWVSYVNHCMW